MAQTETVSALVETHGEKDGEALEGEQVRTTVAGRILGIRSFGKANFLVISDGASRIQIYVRQDSVPERDFTVLGLLDFGDLVGVEGHLFRTRTNELTVWAASLEFLAKCLVPRDRRMAAIRHCERPRPLPGIQSPQRCFRGDV